MSMRETTSGLDRAYGASLIVHAGLITLIVGLAGVMAGVIGQGANAARDGLGLTAALFGAGLLPAVPSAIALLSWWFCRRQGWQPSSGHKSLTVAIAVALTIILGAGFFK